MNRVGMYTGNIYKDNELPTVGECCIIITSEQINDAVYLMELSVKNKLRCSCCNGCPASQQNNKEN